MLFEAKRIKKVRKNYFTGRKKLNKLELMYLEFVLKESKLNWFVKNQKAKNHWFICTLKYSK